MTARSSTLLKGHALQAQDKALISEQGEIIAYDTPSLGCALCQCGATSPVLDSDAARKRWHRDHKTEMRRAEQA